MEEGCVLDRRYTVDGVLGKGGMGTVYLCRNIRLGTLWAVKEVDISKHGTASALVEPNVLKRLEHPALPRVFDMFEESGFLYIVADYIDGVSLDKELSRAGRFGEETVLTWAADICGVLDYLHGQMPNPVIYRDMKPSNIMLCRDGRIKLIDFGIAREYKKDAENDTVYIGTRGYAAPEQFGTGQTSVRTDIYSLGVTLYTLLTGMNPNEPPYAIQPVRSINGSLSEGIEMIIGKCTRHDPDERYGSAVELLSDIRELTNRTAVGNVSGIGGNGDSDVRSHREREIRQEEGPCPGIRPICTFRQLKISVWDNPEFACELAYAGARLAGLKVALFELDTVSERIGWFLGRIPGDGSGCRRESGIDEHAHAAGGLCGTAVIDKLSAVYRGCSNLRYFMLSAGYANHGLKSLVNRSGKVSDLIILHIARSIRDPYTLFSLREADMNITAARASGDVLDELELRMIRASSAHGIPADSFRIVAYEYKKGVDPPERYLERRFPGNMYMGSISYREGREAARNIRRFYGEACFGSIAGEYRVLLSRIGIPVSGRGTGGFGGLLKKLAGSVS